MRNFEKHDDMMRNSILPKVHNLLDTWRAPELGESAPNPDDLITCTSCITVGLRKPMKFKRSYLEAHVKWWEEQELTRRGEGMEPSPETPIACDFCRQGSVASELLASGVTMELLPCPSCLSNNLHPPSTFDRQAYLNRLQAITLQGSDAVCAFADFTRCAKENTDIAILDILSPNVFLSFVDGEDSRLAHELVQKFAREDPGVMFWPKPKHNLESSGARHERSRHAVRKSAVFVVFLSDEYFRHNVRQDEFRAAVENEKFILPLIVEPFAYWSGKEIPPKGVEISKWFPEDLLNKEMPGRATFWSILEHFHPIDFRTGDARAASEHFILQEVCSRCVPGIMTTSLDGLYAEWRSGLPEPVRRELERSKDVEVRLRTIFSCIDEDASGTLDVEELAPAMSMLGLQSDENTRLADLMIEVVSSI